MSLRQIFGDEALDNHHIAPDPIELAVFFVNADLAKAHRPHQATAGLILDEDAGQELPESGSFSRLNQGPQCEPAGAAAPRFTPHVNRSFRDSGVALSGSV